MINSTDLRSKAQVAGSTNHGDGDGSWRRNQHRAYRIPEMDREKRHERRSNAAESRNVSESPNSEQENPRTKRRDKERVVVIMIVTVKEGGVCVTNARNETRDVTRFISPRADQAPDP